MVMLSGQPESTPRCKWVLVHEIQEIQGSTDAARKPELPTGFQRCSCCKVARRKASGCSCRGGKSHQCQKGWTGTGEPPDIPPSNTKKGQEKPKETSQPKANAQKEPEIASVKVTVEIKINSQ